MLHHLFVLIKKAKVNKLHISFEELRDYYDYLREIKKIITKVFEYKKNFLEEANGYLYMIFLDFLKFFGECERIKGSTNQDDSLSTIKFTKKYQLDEESADFDYPVLHLNINRKLWFSTQNYFTLEEIIPKTEEERNQAIINLR